MLARKIMVLIFFKHNYVRARLHCFSKETEKNTQILLIFFSKKKDALSITHNYVVNYISQVRRKNNFF